MRTAAIAFFFLLPLVPAHARADEDLLEQVTHVMVDNNGVQLHTVTIGEGDPVVLLHGFPDYWYSWRHLMPVLAETHQVIALDLRGYNKSDQPEGVDHYAMPHLVSDVIAVLDHFEAPKATVLGHDWGAGIAWQVAMTQPDRVERLVILSVPHPSGFGRELATNEDQQKDSQYARNFQQEGAHKRLTAEGLAGWVDEAARPHYVDAFRRSSFEAMLNYYKASYPTTPKVDAPLASTQATFPRIPCPTLVLHGMKDRALHAAGHAGTWDWIDAPTTLVMIPDANHFLQHDKPDYVNQTIADWLLRPGR